MNRSYTLGIGPRTLQRLRHGLAEARRLNASEDVPEPLGQLAAEARRIEAALPRERLRLPSPRLAEIVRDLLKDGERVLDQAALLNALRDAPLTLQELWSVPTALRIAAIDALTPVGEAIVRMALDCRAAERWLARPCALRRVPSPAFIEHALMRCGEDGLTRPRALLEACLRRRGLTSGQIIRQAHDTRAHLRLRLDNLTATLRLLEGLDWQACFEALSEVDDELSRDPAGVYPLMDDDSRQLIREQVSAIARATGLSERAVARHAVDAARQVKGLSVVEAPKLERLDGIDPKSSCCWWLNDDAGRAALLRRMGARHVFLPRRVPDPHGWGCMAALLLITAALTWLLCHWIGLPWLLPACVPLAWAAADALVGRAFPRFIRPARLLKLNIERLPDAWRTLIVTPVLLTDVQHVDAACDNLEALGCLEQDPNLACLLLGDFADAGAAVMPGDDAIVDRARARVAEMNRRAGQEKYFYLHRPRMLLEADQRWMGRDRKRGALMDLNRVLLGGPSAFTVEGAACDALRGRFAYVVTLDADTRMLPGTAHRLVGALAHPLNWRYAVLQPRMEVAPSAISNRFAKLYAGVGGLDTYPTRVSSLWMDLTGVGVYGGKGVYRVADFQRAVEGRLPGGRVLSHDLIEGALAGAGFLGDVALYDGCPSTLSAWLDRQHRWTRGDWQLLPLMLSPQCPLRLADRFRMLDNLFRSLFVPALWLTLMASVWTGNAEGLAAGLAFAFMNALLRPLDADSWRRCFVELQTLPLTARRMADAALRALWRVTVSGRHLMDWVPSADAERAQRCITHSGRISALLALIGLWAPGGFPAALGLFGVFWAGEGCARALEDQHVDDAPGLTDDQRDMLTALARDTWRFFSESVTPDGPALPPDNVQIDPPVGAARRTSPTNVGLYFLSCVSAQRLGIIDGDECARRVSRALDALDRTEKWRGHLFNWIDIDTLVPLPPRYVSAVDSGNLAACALACANLISDGALAARLRTLAEAMDFAALYDPERQLFHIGMDVDADRPSASHYDLLASESRILSFAALMLGQVPLKHWARLGRSCVPAGNGAALASWSGTMFEYLMPELLMPAPALSLLGSSVRNAVLEQMAQGASWGVSESGYHAFDLHMNYQYRAFGLESLAISGSASGGVVSPYASALALTVQPGRAAENLIQMTRLGWRGELGFYEAADALHPDADGRPALVKSHMAHHQGMTLCAICNALEANCLAAAFMGDPRARALGLLLEERPVCTRHLKPLPRVEDPHPAGGDVSRAARGPLDLHILRGRDATACVAPDGAVHYTRKGFDATRFYGELTHRPVDANVHLRVDGKDIRMPFACRFDAGAAHFEGAAGDMSLAMTVSLSPEDDALYRTVEVKNAGDAAHRVELLDAVPVALAKPRDLLAHPSFQLLFVEAEPFDDSGLLFRRRARNPGETCPALLHAAFCEGPVERDSRFEAVFDREGSPRFDLNGNTGAAINPVSALKVRLSLAPGESGQVCFALRLCDPGETPAIRRLPGRAAALGRARTEALLQFLNIAPGLYHRLDRAAALILDPALAAKAKGDRGPAPAMPVSALWPMGISGDKPLLSMRVSDPGHTASVRAMLRAQCFYRAMGLDTDLALIDAGQGGYDRPVRDMLRGMIDASPLRGQGGVFLLENLTPAQAETIRRASCVALTSDQSVGAQFTALLNRLRPDSEPPALDPGRSLLTPAERMSGNGFGGFTAEGYEIDVLPGRPTPAPWCDILATDGTGLLLTERGGGFIWHGNSRFCRLTGYRGDPALERFPLSLEFISDAGRNLPLLPGERPAMPWRVIYSPNEVIYAFCTERAEGRVAFEISEAAVLITLDLTLRRLRGAVRLDVDWLMGDQRRDAAWTRRWSEAGALFATGTAEGVGWLACDGIDAEAGDALTVPVNAGKNRLRFALGWSPDIPAARQQARAAREGRFPEVQRESNDTLVVRTPDEALNRMMNTFLPHQIRASRVCGRTGYYQPGGAYGFRDQLQDMLALIPLEPERVRTHLLMCARRQFASGDALHWWHMPRLGVRTRIRDDRLFLPWAAAAYVRQTGDGAVLDEVIPYLEDVPIPDGAEDVFREMTPGDTSGTLHDHCMRAFRASDVTGEHGLALMGAGDWNDGMNRVGAKGRGESVWLSEFIAACADSYAEICPVPDDAEWLHGLARRHRGAVELYGWDGGWYLRAYMDDSSPLGSASCATCRIDLIAQAWAVLCGLSPDRCRAALDAAWDQLVDEEKEIIRLLTPSFDGDDPDPGYIRGYPVGVRENGAQYTHAACWLLLALCRMDDAERAHRALQILLPCNHADTPEKAQRYRVEPYVMAADVYYLPGREGRGGWTWYTGSAAWLYMGVLALMGYERRGDRVRLNALLGDWPEVSVTLRFGASRYRLICAVGVERVALDGVPVGGDFISLAHDGKTHEALFPPRKSKGTSRFSGE